MNIDIESNIVNILQDISSRFGIPLSEILRLNLICFFNAVELFKNKNQKATIGEFIEHISNISTLNNIEHDLLSLNKQQLDK